MTSYSFQDFLQKAGITEEEYFQLRERIKNLRIDQICALSELVGIKFDKENLEEIAHHIKTTDTPNIDTIITEADSLENLKLWLEIFEKYR
jgi:hypothetical protein